MRLMRTETKNKGALRLAAYLRVSTADQARSGMGLAAQRSSIEKYAADHGHEIAEWFIDEGESGGLAPRKRAGLRAALDLVHRGGAAGIVSAKLDRLSRSCRDVGDLVADAQNRNWIFISVAEQLDMTTAQGRFYIQVMAGFAELERSMISERTKVALEEVAKRGRIRSSKAPFGWSVALDRGLPKGVKLIEPNKAEQRILKMIVSMRDEGMGVCRIANALNSKKRTQNPRTGNPWTPTNLAQIIRSFDRRNALGVGWKIRRRAA